MGFSFPGVTDIGLFVTAGLLLNITPGVDLLFITSRSAAQGRKAGVVAALGIGTGCLFHVLAASLGLSVILLSSVLVFSIVKYLGAAYLLYLGITTLMSLQDPALNPVRVYSELASAKIFRQGVLVNALNPKVALFFMALLPQFVSPEASSPNLVFLFLGLLFTVNGTIVNIFFALFTSMTSRHLRQVTLLPRILKTLVGALFVTLSVRLALTP